jgi:gamma-glutamylaminecyclotransferase
MLAMSMGDIPRTKWRDKLESHGNVRFVTINTKKRSYEVYNKHLWTIRDGIWYSKGNVAADIPVAVYGTLKKGHNNYFSYLTSSEFVGSGKTKSKYPLVIEGLPYLLQNKGVGHNVRVDVFSVTDDTFNALDKLEGHPNWYFRRRVKIVLDSGAETEAWVYFNKRELKKSDKLHETYTQNYSRGAGYQRHSYDFNKPTWTPSYRQLSFDSIEDAMEHDSEIDMMDEGDECCLKSEVPFCTSCYKDLQHDGHAGYYCEGCNEWYSEEDAKRFVF